MKKLLLISSLLLLSSAPIAYAQHEDITSQIEQIQLEIKDKQTEINDLRQQLNTDDLITFSYDGLNVSVQIEKKAYEGTQDFDDIDIILHVKVENTTDSALAFNPSGFQMFLAGVSQRGLISMDSMGEEAIPGNTEVEGLVHFNVTEPVSNDKDLIVTFKPDIWEFGAEPIFEFKVNDYKHIQ